MASATAEATPTGTEETGTSDRAPQRAALLRGSAVASQAAAALRYAMPSEQAENKRPEGKSGRRAVSASLDLNQAACRDTVAKPGVVRGGGAADGH